MAASSSSVNPTPLAHANNQGEGHPRVTSDQGPRNSSRRRVRFLRLSLASPLSTIQVTVRVDSLPPQFFSPFFPLPPTSREDLNLDGYFEYPLAAEAPNPGIRTQALRHHSQRH
ncbi:hypothetical protein TNCV_1165281 [Trichonephila clavipes]|nr:hypothetical protein TNCV_1165281 [Trichonephila clavipes]